MRTPVGLAAVLLLVAIPLSAQQAAPDPEAVQTFELVCAMCHSVNPPAKAAPPISHAAAYYLRTHGDTETAVAAMVDFLKEPVADRSVMPAHAIERFGLMPPQGHLSDARLRAVARYVMSLASAGDGEHGHGGGNHHGGGGHGNGSHGGHQPPPSD